MGAHIPSLVVNAFYVIMMRTYFSTNIPEAVIEAARIDGAGEFRILLTIVLPMSVPMVANDDTDLRSFPTGTIGKTVSTNSSRTRAFTYTSSFE